MNTAPPHAPGPADDALECPGLARRGRRPDDGKCVGRLVRIQRVLQRAGGLLQLQQAAARRARHDVLRLRKAATSRTRASQISL
jgi:hypothetical protein